MSLSAHWSVAKAVFLGILLVPMLGIVVWAFAQPAYERHLAKDLAAIRHVPVEKVAILSFTELCQKPPPRLRDRCHEYTHVDDLLGYSIAGLALATMMFGFTVAARAFCGTSQRRLALVFGSLS